MVEARQETGASAEALRVALAQWSKSLGPENVLHDAESRAALGRTTLPSAPQPLAILRPATLADVTEALRIAAEHRISLYPISTGRNWGYGDACPVGVGQVVLDLRRMNRIVEVNEELAYAVIEPGVTQGQLAEYLREKGLRLWLDCTGAGPDASVVGNILERGFGHTAYGNRVQTICGMQVLLADGRVLNTGFGHYRNAQASRLFANGLGPMLDGLFTQSNMGIITQLGLWLMPAPEHAEMFVCIVEQYDGIAPVVDALRKLRLDGTVRSIVHIGNEMRLISSSMTFPWHLADGATPLAPELQHALKLQAGIGAWTFSGMLTGGRGQVAASRRAIKRSLKGAGRQLIFLTERRLAAGAFALRYFGIGQWGRGLQQRLRSAHAVFELNRGQPTGQFLAGAYWRHRKGLPAGFPARVDPAKDQCGLIWLSPVLPMTGTAVVEFCGLVQPIYHQHGFEFLVTLSTIADRALGAVMTIAYDKASPEESRRAKDCYLALFDACMDKGYIPYRAGIQSMSELARGSTVFWDAVADIKRALDPQGIMAPGRYEPRASIGRENAT